MLLMTMIADAEQVPGWLQSFIELVPWIIIFVFLWVAVFLYLRKTSDKTNLRSMEDRISALEKAVSELRSRPRT
jgi:hypothetical protein